MRYFPILICQLGALVTNAGAKEKSLFITEVIVVVQEGEWRIGLGWQRNGKNQINLGYIHEIKPTGHGGKLNVGQEKREE